MTRQYLAGELSVLLARVQAVTTGEAQLREVCSLRHAAETVPIEGLGSVALCALVFTEGLCWDSLAEGDAASFCRQSAACAELYEFGVCSGLLNEGYHQG
jgi:hypothetical protein